MMSWGIPWDSPFVSLQIFNLFNLWTDFGWILWSIKYLLILCDQNYANMELYSDACQLVGDNMQIWSVLLINFRCKYRSKLKLKKNNISNTDCGHLSQTPKTVKICPA